MTKYNLTGLIGNGVSGIGGIYADNINQDITAEALRNGFDSVMGSYNVTSIFTANTVLTSADIYVQITPPSTGTFYLLPEPNSSTFSSSKFYIIENLSTTAGRYLTMRTSGSTDYDFNIMPGEVVSVYCDGVIWKRYTTNGVGTSGNIPMFGGNGFENSPLTHTYSLGEHLSSTVTITGPEFRTGYTSIASGLDTVITRGVGIETGSLIYNTRANRYTSIPLTSASSSSTSAISVTGSNYTIYGNTEYILAIPDGSNTTHWYNTILGTGNDGELKTIINNGSNNIGIVIDKDITAHELGKYFVHTKVPAITITPGNSVSLIFIKGGSDNLSYWLVLSYQ